MLSCFRTDKLGLVMVLPLFDYIKPRQSIYVLKIIIYRMGLWVYMLSILQNFKEDLVGNVSHPRTNSSHERLVAGRWLECEILSTHCNGRVVGRDSIIDYTVRSSKSTNRV